MHARSAGRRLSSNSASRSRLISRRPRTKRHTSRQSTVAIEIANGHRQAIFSLQPRQSPAEALVAGLGLEGCLGPEMKPERVLGWGVEDR